MLVYFGIFSFLSLGVIIEQISKNKRMRENFFMFSLLLLILFFGLRGYIGYDWYSYKPNFDKMVNIVELLKNNSHNLLSSYEIGFQIYTSLIKSITSNYFFYNFINTTIDFIILLFVIKKYSKYPILSLLLFFGVYGVALEIDMLRNVKSILLFLISIEFIEKQKFLIFMILNILGIFFHTSSIIYLPMYFILRKKWNKKFILFLFILGNIYYLLDIRLGIKIIKEYNNLLPSGIGSKLSSYFSIIPLDFPLGFSLYYFERVILFLLCWFAGDSLYKKEYGNIMLNSIYISIFFFLYFSEFSIISMRFSLLFIYSYWFILPLLLEIYPKLPVIIIAFMVSLFRLNNQINFIGNREVYSYQNILINFQAEDIQIKKVENASKYKKDGHGKEISLLF